MPKDEWAKARRKDAARRSKRGPADPAPVRQPIRKKKRRKPSKSAAARRERPPGPRHTVCLKCPDCGSTRVRARTEPGAKVASCAVCGSFITRHTLCGATT